MPSRGASLRPLWHGLILLGLAAALNLVLLGLYQRRPHTPEAREKQAAYLRAPGEWNLLFLGDSRTYTDFDPDALDPLLGTHSLNLAYWAQWFPTQYASYRELIPHIPPGTVVVWSVGEQNFRSQSVVVNSTYPIRPWLLPRYVGWGYAVTDLQDNVAGGVLDVIPAHALRDPLRHYLAARAGGVRTGASDAGAANEAGVAPEAGGSATTGQGEFERRRARYAADPRVERVRAWVDEGRVTSVEVLTRRGFYLRDEIDTTFFRRKQAEMAARTDTLAGDYTAEPRYWKTFVAILDEFQRHHVRLVVNRVEEAPFRYAHDANRPAIDAFMAKVQHEVEARGYPWLSVDWGSFDDADYFDFNHLNRRGVERFTPRFATALAPHLR